MTIADLRPGVLDIPMTQGNDLVLRCNFNISLSGWTAWEANARSDATSGGTVLPFTVDTTSQGSGTIVATLPAASTALFSEAKWDMKAIDADGKNFTILAGIISAATGIS